MKILEVKGLNLVFCLTWMSFHITSVDSSLRQETEPKGVLGITSCWKADRLFPVYYYPYKCFKTLSRLLINLQNYRVSFGPFDTA